MSCFKPCSQRVDALGVDLNCDGSASDGRHLGLRRVCRGVQVGKILACRVDFSIDLNLPAKLLELVDPAYASDEFNILRLEPADRVPQGRDAGHPGRLQDDIDLTLRQD